jgi:DNA (cytosine-5)-methyltransferase 1
MKTNDKNPERFQPFHAAPSSQFRVLDLFSGIGGFALATEWAGGETMAFAEVADFPSKVLGSRWPNIPNLGSVTKLCRRIYDCEPNPNDDESIWCPRYDADFGECDCIGTDQFTDTYGWPDVIAGGVPCQPASLVGKRRGSSDERWLWPDTLRIIGELQPRYAILENPRAILTLEGGNAFRGILGGFADLGYDVQWDVVSASALGAGHRRERLWILAMHPDSPRLEGHAGNGEAGGGQEAGRHAPPENLREREIASPLWYHQSGIQSVVDGIPGGVARDQLTAVGNSLVPQVALVWLRGIAALYAATLKRGTASDRPQPTEIYGYKY